MVKSLKNLSYNRRKIHIFARKLCVCLRECETVLRAMYGYVCVCVRVLTLVSCMCVSKHACGCVLVWISVNNQWSSIPGFCFCCLPWSVGVVCVCVWCEQVAINNFPYVTVYVCVEVNAHPVVHGQRQKQRQHNNHLTYILSCSHIERGNHLHRDQDLILLSHCFHWKINFT